MLIKAIRQIGFVCMVAAWPAVAQTQTTQAAAAAITYTLGPGDEVTVNVADAEELKDSFLNSFVLDSDGYVTIPLAGSLHAAGLTPGQLQDQIRDGMKKYVRDPHVSVNVKTMKSQSVSVLGAVTTPGVHQVSGPKTLDEVLALAGGLAKDAGYKITITRERKWGPIPLPGAAMDPSGQFCIAEVNTRQLTEAKDPSANILIKPNDVVTVPHAEVVYVIGEVKKAGGFTLGDRRQLSALEALSLAEGATATASQGRAKILRSVPGSVERRQINIDLKKVMQGKVEDMELSANDILFIPDNSRKRAGVKIAEAAITTISGLIIWRGL